MGCDLHPLSVVGCGYQGWKPGWKQQVWCLDHGSSCGVGLGGGAGETGCDPVGRGRGGNRGPDAVGTRQHHLS